MIFPTGNIYMPGESLWGKVLPDGNYGVNNTPLHPSYRWQDIVSLKELPNEDEAYKVIVHRRWKCQTYFKFTEPKDSDEALGMRKKIFDILLPIGHPGFVWAGLGYLLLEEDMTDEKAFEKISEALSAVGIDSTLAS